MALTVGTNSYITLTEVATYLAENYISTDSEYITWNALSEANKEVYLRKACKKIDRQKYVGLKAVSTQTLEFPRSIRSEYSRDEYPDLIIKWDDRWVTQSAVPQKVKDAQAEEAFALALGKSKRIVLQEQGVKAFGLGNLSESYSGPSDIKLISLEAKELLRPYLLGCVNIS